MARCVMKRRDFLQTGMFGGFLSLVDILRLRAERPGGASKPARSVIMIVLPGGPSQIDTFDPKPNAPEGIRGEYRPIRTRVPGINVCELLPRHAEVMGRLAVVRAGGGGDLGQTRVFPAQDWHAGEPEPTAATVDRGGNLQAAGNVPSRCASLCQPSSG